MSTTSEKNTVSNQSGTTANTSSGAINNTQNSANNVDPWAPQATAIQNAFAEAQRLYGLGSQAQAPTDFTAQMSPEQLGAFHQMISQGSNLSLPQGQAAMAGQLGQAGAGGVTGALNGLNGYDPSGSNNTQSHIDAANRYVSGQDIDGQVRNSMLNATQTARDVTMPGIGQGAALSGNASSSRRGIAEGMVQRGLAQQSNDLGATLRNNAFQQGLGLSQQTANNNNQLGLGALTAQGSLGNSAAGMGINAGNSSVTNTGALSDMAATGGAGMTAAEQANLNNQYQQYMQATQGNYGALSGLMGIIGNRNWGSSSTGSNTSNTATNAQSNGFNTSYGNATETSTPSQMSTISGLLGGAGSALSGLKGLGGMAGLGALFGSDRRIKEDITRIGTTDNGLPLYTFRYIGDPEKRLNVGVMAQDVEKVRPEAVHEIGGIKLVDYAKALA